MGSDGSKMKSYSGSSSELGDLCTLHSSRAVSDGSTRKTDAVDAFLY